MTRTWSRFARWLLAWAVFSFAFGTFRPAEARADEIVLVATASSAARPRPARLALRFAVPRVGSTYTATREGTLRPASAKFVFTRAIYLRNRSLLR